MPVNQIERAFRAWPILVATAAGKDKISYGNLAKMLSIHHRAVRYVLSLIQDYCLEEHLPPLTILIVNSSGKPGSGFIAYDLARFDEGLEEVWSYDWSVVENPFDFSRSGYSLENFVRVLSESPEDSEEIYSNVKSRGIKQLVFRSALLSVYQGKCAFTRMSFTEALEACHIIPWSQATEAQRLDVRNGLLLNSLHHRLFDRGYMTISVDYEIIYRDPKDDSGSYSEFHRLATWELHRKKMHLPFRLKHRPLPAYVSKQHELAEWDL